MTKGAECETSTSRWPFRAGLCVGSSVPLIIFALVVPILSWAIATLPALVFLQWQFLEKGRFSNGQRTWWSGVGFGSLTALLFCAMLTPTIFFYNSNSASAIITVLALVLSPAVVPAIVAKRTAAVTMFASATTAMASLLFAEDLFNPAIHRDTALEFAIVMAGEAVVLWLAGWITFAVERKRLVATLITASLPVFIAIAALALGLF